jgi:pimeloyl-ACP methyl ester carboxylesterase
MKTPPRCSPWFPGLILVLVLALVVGCGSSRRQGASEFRQLNAAHLPPPTLTIEIPGLSNCTTEEDRLLKLNAGAPVTLLVHGCTGSAGNFYTLADVFAFHGQQTVCFNYDDRESMWVTVDQLGQAVSTLAGYLNPPDITIIGHSQGGLIARKTLVKAAEDPAGWETDTRLRLVTISSPFAGIEAARHCGSTTVHILSLGFTVPICWMISGDKWYEITAVSDFIRQPGRLPRGLDGYFKIDTDERGSCRRFDGQGRCREDDFVFSLPEQQHADIDTDAQVNKVEIKAGHAGVIGSATNAPEKLVRTLQTQGILAPTPPEDRLRLASLLRDLYRRP